MTKMTTDPMTEDRLLAVVDHQNMTVEEVDSALLSFAYYLVDSDGCYSAQHCPWG